MMARLHILNSQHHQMQMTKTQLIALDVDGTLLGEDCCIPQAHRDAIEYIRKQGDIVVIATGRPLLTTVPLWDSLGLDTPIVCFDGTWIGYPNQQALYEHPLSCEDVQDILVELQRGDGAISLYNESGWFMNRATQWTKHFPKLYNTTIHFGEEQIQQWTEPSPKVMYVCDPDLLQTMVDRIHSIFEDRFHVVTSQFDRFEIHQPLITKAWGLERLIEHLNIERENVWAVGDSANDFEMIRWAGHGCAMGQASDLVKNVATHILPSIDNAGLSALPDLLYG